MHLVAQENKNNLYFVKAAWTEIVVWAFFSSLEHLLTYVNIVIIFILTYVRKDEVCLSLQNAEK